ncbi:MAG: hypothetical protein ACI82H_000632 [Alphaproteobacteria bacterium]|jgi:hypothetical protein
MQNHGLAEIEAQVAGEQGTADRDIINIAGNRCARSRFKLRLNGYTDTEMLSPFTSTVIATFKHRHIATSP